MPGWNVIKVLWGSEWDSLFARDTNQVLLRRFAETVDGEYQDLGSKDGDYNRAKFFDTDPATRKLVEHMTDAEINRLKRGGHDLRKHSMPPMPQLSLVRANPQLF